MAGYRYTEIPIESVNPGMFIEFDLSWFKHPFYSNSFRVKSPGEIVILKDAGIRSVKYFPDRSIFVSAAPKKTSPASSDRPHRIVSTPDVILRPKQLQSEELQKKQARLETLEREYKSVYSRISNIVKVVESDIKAGVEATQEFLSDTIKSLEQETEILMNMVTSQMTKDNIDSLHQLNVLYLSLFLGKAMGLSHMQLYELGAAAFFHDIGKARIPRKILSKQPPYTPAERQYLELHPQYGVAILGEVKSISNNVIEAIHEHHEMCDGTGYPRKMTSETISLMAKIVNVVNTYDNLCNRYLLKRLLSPHESLSYMYTRLRDGLSVDIIMNLIKTIGVYPSGCLVELSDGNLGIVIATNQRQSTKPTIILYDASTPREKPLIINLSDIEGLSIVRSIRPTEAPEEVVTYLQRGDRTGLYLGSLLSQR